jgi:hypothetical protein
MSERKLPDESYVLDLCDRVLGFRGIRQHRFPFLLGDGGRALPVDAYYPDLKLVIEYRETQHTNSVPIFDRKQTVSGVFRGEQRRLYDQRRREILPQNNITLVEFDYSEFQHSKRCKLLRLPEDESIVRAKLGGFV